MIKNNIDQFDKWSKQYDDGVWAHYFNAGYDRALNTLEVHDGDRILDVGCGTATLFKKINAKYSNVVMIGVDSSEQMIEHAKRKIIPSLKNNNKVIFINSRAEDLSKIDPESIDVLYCLNSFHHHEQSRSLAEFCRVLKQDASGLILDPFVDGPLRKIWVRIVDSIFGEKGVEYLTKSDMIKLIEKSCFKVTSMRKFLFFTLFTAFKKV